MAELPIVNKTLECGLFIISINETWIYEKVLEMYNNDNNYNFEKSINKSSANDILIDCIYDIEQALNERKYSDIDEIVHHCVHSYAELFLK